MKHTQLMASVAAAALLAGPVQAQDFFDLGELVISATLEPVEVNRTGATVEVLQDEDLDDAQISLTQRLAREPGVSFSANGGFGATETLRIRGLDASNVGVRIDGIDVSDPSGPQHSFNFGGLGRAGIGRVEILKGSQSALYGSEAIAGVVDISTLGATELGFNTRITAEAGSFGTQSASVAVTNVTDRGEIALSLSRVVTDGISARAGDDEKDGFAQTFVTLAGKHALTDTVALGFSGFYRIEDVEFDRSAASAFGPADNSGEIENTQNGARVFAEIDALGMEHTLSYSFFDIARRDPDGFISQFDGSRDEISYRGTAELGGMTTLTVGLDNTREEFATTTDKGETETNSALAELLYRPVDTLDLSLSLRHDDHSEFGGQTSARVAMAWRAKDDLTIRAVAGTGYRAPSLFERFSVYGSPDLEVEESLSFELGVEKALAGDGFIKATAFYTEIDNLIDFDGASTACGSGFGCYTQVPGLTVSKGLELSGRVAVKDRISVYGNYTLTDAETDGTRTVLVPRHDLVLGVDAQLTDRLSGGFEVHHVADVEASPFAPADNKVGDYTVANMQIGYEVTDRAEAYLRVENLFDQDYETTGGFNMPGRAVFVGLRADF